MVSVSDQMFKHSNYILAQDELGNAYSIYRFLKLTWSREDQTHIEINMYHHFFSIPRKTGLKIPHYLQFYATINSISKTYIVLKLKSIVVIIIVSVLHHLPFLTSSSPNFSSFCIFFYCLQLFRIVASTGHSHVHVGSSSSVQFNTIGGHLVSCVFLRLLYHTNLFPSILNLHYHLFISPISSETVYIKLYDKMFGFNS